MQALLIDEANRAALVATNDRRIRAWDLVGGVQVATYAGHADCVRALGVLPDKARLGSHQGLGDPNGMPCQSACLAQHRLLISVP